MTDTASTRLPSWSIRLGALSALAIAIWGLWGFQMAFAQKDKDKPAHTSEEHVRETTNLKQAFGGVQIDVFFEMGELETQKPGLAGLKFVDAVDVTGKELLRFERSGDSWLIDPDTVFAYHLHKPK